MALINVPDSTVEDLENDLANLDLALRLASWARNVENGEDDGPSDAADNAKGIVEILLSNGAGGYDAGALVAWLKEKIAETENTIDALEGAGPPLEGGAS